jgi:hypothetical protein
MPGRSVIKQAICRGLRPGLWLFLMAAWGAAPQARGTSREYDLKAAFLYNFASFTTWPPGAFARRDSPFVIGVMGRDPFGPSLDELVQGGRVRGHPVEIRRFMRLAAARECHILFISASERRSLREILDYCRGRPILTVGDLPGFAEEGGAIAFVTGSRVSIRINTAAIEQSHMVVSSKLLRLAHVIHVVALAP